MLIAMRYVVMVRKAVNASNLFDKTGAFAPCKISSDNSGANRDASFCQLPSKEVGTISKTLPFGFCVLRASRNANI